MELEKDMGRDPIKVVCFYSRIDQRLLEFIITYLKPLQDEKLITFWSDIDTPLGTAKKDEMYRRLKSACIILLLMSPDFLASDDWSEIERQAMDRCKRGKAHVIPVILRSCSWKHTLIGDLTVLPRDEKPIADLGKNKRDEAFLTIAEEIRCIATTCLAEEEKRHYAQERTQVRQETSLAPSDLPTGWIPLKRGYLEKYRRPLTPEEALFYFEGGIPDWQVALSSQIPRREKASALYKIIEEAYLTGPGVTVLLGGGGEGKSTMLRQVVCDLVFAKAPWNLIWHEDENEPLSVDFCRKLPRNQGAWLIASDEADRIASDVFAVVTKLRKEGRKDIHFFLCCREIDWKGVGADKYEWRSFSKFESVPLGGLNLKDARLIIDAWSRDEYEGKGLARLASYSPDEATEIFMQKAQSELSKADGSLLGALLETRYPGRSLDERVLALLNRLRAHDKEFQRDVFDAYKYIVALHAENQLILTKDLLARVLSCSIGKLQQNFIGLLEREAATATRPSGSEAILPSNKYVFARHRVIAEAAVRILTERFYIDFDDTYERLFRSAIEMFHDGGRRLIPEILKWRELPRYFFDNGKKDLAFRLAGLVMQLEPGDFIHVVLFSRLSQDDEQFERGAKIFRETFENIPEKRRDRLYYHEWATAEGKAENHAISAWLDGIALSDGIPYPNWRDRYIPTDYDIIALDGMSIDFELLSQQTGNPTFQRAWGATVQLGLSLKRTEETKNAYRRLQRSQERYIHAGGKIGSLSLAVEYMQKGIVAAWESSEVPLPRDVRQGKVLTFSKFQDQIPKK